MSFPSRGIIYIVTGQKFVEEACRSAASVKQCMPDILITICSDIPLNSPLFDQVMAITNPMYGVEDKILITANSPYQETLFLDSDTYAADDSREPLLTEFSRIHEILGVGLWPQCCHVHDPHPYDYSARKMLRI